MRLFIRETPIGNIQSNTFHPTEAEKLILMNVSDMIEQGRNVTQQDAINVPEEKEKENEISPDQLETAFAQLLKLQMLTQQPDQTLQLSQSGQSVVAELKKAADQEALTQGSDKEPQGQPEPGLDMGMGGGQSMGVGASPQQASPMAESFSLIRYLNDMAKLLG